MKIIIDSMDELLQLSELIHGPKFLGFTDPAANWAAKQARAPRAVPTEEFQARWTSEALARTEQEGADLHASLNFETAPTVTDEPDGLPADIAAPSTEAATAAPDNDVDGVPHDADWHSVPAKLNADGRWRARRKRDEAAYAEWVAGWEPLKASEPGDQDEPIATETHSLPQDEPQADDPEPAPDSRDAGAGYAAPAVAGNDVDLVALLAASQDAAGDASDSLSDLLTTCRDFTSARGHAAFNALKAVVAPRGDSGASLQDFTPGERRLMQACVANYPKPE